MTTARASQTATLLGDGRVLIAGGAAYITGGGLSSLASAELYDPRTGKFRATGSMAHARVYHTATLLPDGRVLIAGGMVAVGDGRFAALAAAELYDPTTGIFSVTGSMATARFSQTATLLGDGCVLVTGGIADPSTGRTSLASAELYDPTTGSFRPTGSMATARDFQTATRLTDGRVLIVGGEGVGAVFRPLASAELYDPTTGKFRPTGSMAHARVYHTATLLPDGRVLVAGGENRDSNPWLSSAELYAPNTGKFGLTGSMTGGSVFGTATLLTGGSVLVAGGLFENNFLPFPELYDPATDKFNATLAMSAGRSQHTATLLADGRVVIVGGNNSSGTLASAELYEP